MSVHTCLFMDAKLKPATPAEVINALAFMVDRDQLGYVDPVASQHPTVALPMHPLFETVRWPSLFSRSSSELDKFPNVRSKLDTANGTCRLLVSSSINKAWNEIRLLCDWIGPYVDAESDTQVGRNDCLL